MFQLVLREGILLLFLMIHKWNLLIASLKGLQKCQVLCFQNVYVQFTAQLTAYTQREECQWRQLMIDHRSEDVNLRFIVHNFLAFIKTSVNMFTF
jgi:hypothetical protein